MIGVGPGLTRVMNGIAESVAYTVRGMVRARCHRWPPQSLEWMDGAFTLRGQTTSMINSYVGMPVMGETVVGLWLTVAAAMEAGIY
jgi:hypothetical protein